MSSLSLSRLCLLLSAEGVDRKINIRKKRWKLIIEKADIFGNGVLYTIWCCELPGLSVREIVCIKNTGSFKISNLTNL